MDYQDFTRRDEAFKSFVELRKKVLDATESSNFAEVFTDLCSNALAGDCVAQDVTAYFFNRGIADPDFSNRFLVSPNYEFHMSWQILAGANGNEFALEKLEFFLNPALEQIVDNEELLTVAMKRKNITKKNALFVISNLICEGIVDEMGLNPKELVQIDSNPSYFSTQKNRPFLDAMQKCLPEVEKFLIS